MISNFSNANENEDLNKQGKAWVGTHYTILDKSILKDKLIEIGATYLIIGSEICPSTNRPHLQFYFESDYKKRVMTMRKILGCWCYVARGDAQENNVYCRKDNDHIEFGQRRRIKGKDKSDRYQHMIELASQSKFEEIIDLYPQHAVNRGLRNLREITTIKNEQTSFRYSMMCLWIYSKKPGTGKSRFAYEKFPQAYWKLDNKWFENYLGQDVIVWDELRKSHEHSLDKLLRWSDGYPCRAEVKNGSVMLNHTKFIVTSNFHPYEIWGEEEAKPVLRRFLCVEALEWDDKENDLLCKVEGRKDMKNFIDEIKKPVHLFTYLTNFCVF